MMFADGIPAWSFLPDLPSQKEGVSSSMVEQCWEWVTSCFEWSIFDMMAMLIRNVVVQAAKGEPVLRP